MLAVVPSSGAISAGSICSISVYQSTSCQCDGSDRKARAVSLRSSVSSSIDDGSATVSSSSVAVSCRARPQAAAVLRMLVNRWERNDPLGPPPLRMAWWMRANDSRISSSGSIEGDTALATAMPDGR